MTISVYLYTLEFRLFTEGNMMKKIFLFLFLMVSFINVHAAKINNLIFFGDSLSDNGNLYSLLLHVIPKSPPYFDGRFTNGTTWAENLGKYYYNKNYADYKIYAVGGATAVFHLPSSKFFSPTLLSLEVDKYLLDSIFTNKSNTMFVIWIGGNDYLFDENADMEQATSKVVNKISWAVNRLRIFGGKNFLVLNLPDLSRIPKTQDGGSTDLLHAVTVLHNQKLDAAMQALQSDHPDIQITSIDIYGLFNDVMANPEKYNEKYNIHVTNIKDACWTGGIWLKQANSSKGLAKEIQQSLATSKMKAPENFDAQAVSNLIVHSPVLAHAYQMSQSYERGNIPCANPDEYLFWDAIHPTAVVHQILSQIVIEQLGDQIA